MLKGMETHTPLRHFGRLACMDCTVSLSRSSLLQSPPETGKVLLEIVSQQKKQGRVRGSRTPKAFCLGHEKT